MTTHSDFLPLAAAPAEAHAVARAPAGERIAWATLALALFAFAPAALASTEAATIAIPVVLMLCIVGVIFAVGFSIEGGSALPTALLIALPFAAGIYYALLHVLAGVPMAAGLSVLALPALYAAATGKRLRG